MAPDQPDTDSITMRLTRAEAVVLDAFLDRWEMGNAETTLRIRDRAEQLLLYKIHNSIEPAIEYELRDSGYDLLLAACRDEVRKVWIDCPPIPLED